ncbi:MAG: FmdB family zinc ribbon protein [Sporichthyaceae bacterium]
MPTYQYACTACEHQFEAVQKFSDATLTECPECAGKLRKVFSAVGVVFKGSGFYRTDSRGKQASSEPPAKTETKATEKKTETKAETKSSGKSGGESAA